MFTPRSFLSSKLARVIAVGAVAATGVMGVRMSGSSDVSWQAQEPVAVASFEASLMPKVGPTWQRPAPLTWSSRFNVRWEARWSNEGKYMV